MICKECGTDLNEDAAFCQHCGARVGGGSPESEPTAGARFRAAVETRQTDDDSPEQEVWEGHYSKLAMIGSWIVAAVVTVVALVIGALAGPAGWAVAGGVILVMWVGLVGLLLYRQLSIRYRLTDQRFIHERGLLWRTIDRIEVIDIDDVTFNQGPIERLLGVGNIRITSSDRTDPEFEIKGIENVRDVAGKLDDLRRNERRKRGLHIESV